MRSAQDSGKVNFMTPEIRDMRPDEAETFLRVHHASVRGLAALAYPPEVIADWAPSPITPEAVAAFLANPDRETRLVAATEGRIVGVGVLVPYLAELRACYVAPDAVRCGVGSTLVRALERRALDRGLTALHLDASLNAEAFYRALGYRALARGAHVLRSGRRMACVKMARDLRAG